MQAPASQSHNIFDSERWVLEFLKVLPVERDTNVDRKLPHVPGTVLLNDEAAHSEQVTGGLKHGTGRNAHIVLAPQPSEDPNDPLNWSSWRKEMCMYVLCFGAMLNAATIGPLLNSSIVVIATDLQRSITDIVVISGYNLLAVGASGYVQSRKV
jgi:hypothetical protein